MRKIGKNRSAQKGGKNTRRKRAKMTVCKKRKKWLLEGGVEKGNANYE